MKTVRIDQETHKKIKAIAVLKDMKLYEICNHILDVYSKEMLKKYLEEM